MTRLLFPRFLPLLAVLVPASGFGGPVPVPAPDPVPAAFHLSDEQVRLAASNLDAAWEAVFRAWWRQEQEIALKYQRPVVPVPEMPGPASDEVFLRRAMLDATGLIPSEEETRLFLLDLLPDKRRRLVERLLLGPGWGRHLFNRYAELFRLQDQVGGVPQTGYIALLRAAAETGVPFDRLVAELITASGTVVDDPATGFLLRDQGNLLLSMEHVAGGLLRIDAHCARCHDHPFCDLTQKQFYQMAACFGATQVTLRPPNQPGLEVEVWPEDQAGSQRDGLLSVRDGLALGLRFGRDYKYRDGKPGAVVKPAKVFSPGPGDLPKVWSGGRGLRGEFA